MEKDLIAKSKGIPFYLLWTPQGMYIKYSHNKKLYSLIKRGEAVKREKEDLNDIQLLKEIGIDWNYQPKNLLGKRSYARLCDRYLTTLFEVRSIQVMVNGPVFTMNASLLDVSQGGMAITVKKELFLETILKVLFNLSGRRIIATCVVRQVGRVKGIFKAGLEFVNLRTEDSQYIAGLYSSKAFSKDSSIQN